MKRLTQELTKLLKLSEVNVVFVVETNRRF